MELKLVREVFTSESTVGSLFIDGRFTCFTLEDRVRPVKVKGSTAIPYGHYEIVITFSARFQRQLPLLLNVPNFDGIRIHPGNQAKDTDGCILVGAGKTADFVGNSKAAFEPLFNSLAAASRVEKIFIEITQAG